MKLLRALVLIASMISALLMSASQTLAGEKYPQSLSVFLHCNKPVLTPVTGYPEEQTKGQISIKCVATPFTEKVMYHKTLKEKPKGLLSLQSGNTAKYLVTEKPVAYSFEPTRLSFNLRFANNTDHVLRFGDCLISLLIDNQQVPMEKTAEEQLRKIVILPKGTAELKIFGPAVQSDRVLDTTKTVMDTAKVIMLSLFDVTVEVDDANNPTKKATFDWIFENKPVAVSSTLQAVTTEEKLMPSDAQKMNDQWYFK